MSVNKEYHGHQQLQPSNGEPGGNSGCENTGCWPQTAEEYIKGMISVSSDSFFFPFVEKQSIR